MIGKVININTNIKILFKIPSNLMYRVLSIVPLIQEKHGKTQFATHDSNVLKDGSKIAGLWIKLVGLSLQVLPMVW